MVFCLYCIVAGLAWPIKLEIQGDEAIVRYLLWKQIVKVTDINSYTVDLGAPTIGHTQHFVTVKLNNGRKIKFFDLREDNSSLIALLERWMGLKPVVDFPEELKEPPIEETRAEPAAPVPLSERTEQLVQKMFPLEEQMEVRQLLINQCGNNIDAHKYKDKYELEFLRFSVLKVSKGDMKKMHRAIKIANEDFRDIYAESGFLGKKAEEKREKWVRTILNKK